MSSLRIALRIEEKYNSVLAAQISYGVHQGSAA